MAKTKKRTLKLIEVEWVDAIGGSGAWTEIQKMEDTIVMGCFSVGYLFQETKSYILLVPHWHPSKGNLTSMNGFGEIAIPKIAIKKMRILKKVEMDV